MKHDTLKQWLGMSIQKPGHGKTTDWNSGSNSRLGGIIMCKLDCSSRIQISSIPDGIYMENYGNRFGNR